LADESLSASGSSNSSPALTIELVQKYVHIYNDDKIRENRYFGISGAMEIPAHTLRDGNAGSTLADKAARILGEAILSGQFEAGSRLHVRQLADQIGIGATPLREGLSRLLARGLVIAIGQRGFRVAPMSRDDLEDILRTRTALETEAIRLSITHGNDDWEAEIVASLHRLMRFLERSPGDARAVVSEFDDLHKAFHTSLIAACQSSRMLELHSVLHDQGYRYRHLMMASFDPARVAEVHQHLAGIVLARDTEAAVSVYRDHLQLLVSATYSDDADPEAVAAGPVSPAARHTTKRLPS
jgi:DNA-binding GntR family transcriptional regulator